MDSSQAVQKSRATIKSYRRTLAKRAAREVTFSDLSESELAQLFTTDEYESDYYRFQVSGFDVLVKNELLAEALNALPERKRDIILYSGRQATPEPVQTAAQESSTDDKELLLKLLQNPEMAALLKSLAKTL